MTTTPDLDDVRARIDAIDDQIQDLIVRRAGLVSLVAAAKGAVTTAGVARPGREAAIVRRLLERHAGPFPASALVRIWREMMSSFVQMQASVAVAVALPPDDVLGFWDVARDHFGSITPLLPVNSQMAALRAIGEGTATFAVLPVPLDDDADPWWRALATDDAGAPRICMRLPFATAPDAYERACYVLGPIRAEATGHDCSGLIVELGRDMSRGRLKDALTAAGLPPRSFRSRFDSMVEGASQHLVEIADAVAPGDPRLDHLREALGESFVRVNVVGCWPDPIRLPA
jgi:chorismate mutase/prephenate dehydratase